VDLRGDLKRSHRTRFHQGGWEKKGNTGVVTTVEWKGVAPNCFLENYTIVQVGVTPWNGVAVATAARVGGKEERYTRLLAIAPTEEVAAQMVQ